MTLLRKSIAPIVISLFCGVIFSTHARADYQALIGLDFQRGAADRGDESVKQEINTRSQSVYLKTYFSPVDTQQNSNPASLRYAAFLAKASGFGFSYRRLMRDNDVILLDSGSEKISLGNEEEDRLAMDGFFTVAEKLFLGIEFDQTEYDNTEKESLRTAKLNIGYYIFDNARITGGFGRNRRQFKPYFVYNDTINNDTFSVSYFHVFRHQSLRPISLELNFDEEQNWQSTLSLTAEYTLTSNIIIGFKMTQSDIEVNDSDFDGQFIRFKYYWSEKFALLSYLGKGAYDYASTPDMDSKQAGLSLQHYF